VTAARFGGWQFSKDGLRRISGSALDVELAVAISCTAPFCLIDDVESYVRVPDVARATARCDVPFGRRRVAERVTFDA
jgi:hypothetical protein